jgi:hypothetical protein
MRDSESGELKMAADAVRTIGERAGIKRSYAV